MPVSSDQRFNMDDVLESYRKGRREGLREGRRDGRHVGWREGERGATARIFCHLLALRFGDSAVKSAWATIDSAGAKRLVLWMERLLTAETIEDVFV